MHAEDYYTNCYTPSIQYHIQSNDIDANIAMILNQPEVMSAFARKNEQEGTDIDALKEELTNKMKDKFQADASSGIPIATTAVGLLVQAKEEARKVPTRRSKRKKDDMSVASAAAAAAVYDVSCITRYVVATVLNSCPLCLNHLTHMIILLSISFSNI